MCQSSGDLSRADPRLGGPWPIGLGRAVKGFELLLLMAHAALERLPIAAESAFWGGLHSQQEGDTLSNIQGLGEVRCLAGEALAGFPPPAWD